MSSMRFSLAVLFVATLAACSKTEVPAPAASPNTATGDELIVKIGVSGALTGPQAHIGKDNENGTRMAIEDANAKGVIIRWQESALRSAQRRRSE